MTARPLLLLLLTVPFAGSTVAQVSVFEPTTGDLGNVRILDETGQNPDALPAPLQGIEILPIDFVGRTNFHILDPTRPRRFDDVPGAGRLRLPGGGGSLYQYRRPDLQGGLDAYGFFLVGSDGRARPVFELAAAPSNSSPFLERIAVPPGGDAFLVATSPEAEGDLYEVELETGSATLRTASIPPLDFRSYGLALMEGWGVGLSETGPLRFARTPGAQGEFVTFPITRIARARSPFGPRTPVISDGGPPAWFGADVVTCADQSTVAIVAGDQPALAYVWTFQVTGEAVRASTVPQHISGAGFLPDTLVGPTLAISTDGSRVAYRVQEPVSREAFVRQLEPTGTMPVIQVTADANFTDTLNDSGVISFMSADDAIILVGETDSNDPLQIDRADIYRVAGIGGAITLANLTQTSGETTAPFLEAGDLDTGDGMFLLPDGSGLLIYEDPGGSSGLVRHVDLVTGVITEVINTLDDFGFIDRIGNDALFSTLPDNGTGGSDVYYFPSGGSVTQVGSINGQFTSWATHSSGEFASLIDMGLPGRILARIDLIQGTGQTLSLTPIDYGATVAYTPAAAIAATANNTTSAFAFTWSHPDHVKPLGTGNPNTFVLPGR